jgi:hypothetical protein
VSAVGFDAAPDLAESIDAWRIWRVVARDGGVRLMSVLQPTVWPAGRPLVAECRRLRASLPGFRRKHRHVHAAPGEHCECGVYGTALAQIRQYLTPAPADPAAARVLGRVSLWGTVVECERGFRASHAYPSRIYVPVDASRIGLTSSDELVAGLQAYDVEVEFLPVRCVEATEVLAKLAA